VAGEAPAPVRRPKRRPYRRDQIIDAAIDLFFERGYHSTGMDEIGVAAGITGPGIYRHFKNRDDVLAAALERAATQMMGGVEEIVLSSTTPEETLDGLVRNFIGAVLNRPALAELVLYERRMFPPEPRDWFDRVHRLHVEEWVHALSEVHPALSEGEVRLMVGAAMGLLGSVMSYRSGLARPQLDNLLRQMALDALLGDKTRARDISTSTQDEQVTTEARSRKPGRKDVILEAATRLFAEKSFAGTTVDEIGVAAGISGPGVYRHFSSKDEILKTLIEQAIERLVAAQESPLQSDRRPTELLEDLVARMVDDTLAYLSLASLLWTEQRHLTPDTRALVRRVHRMRTAEWVHVLSRVLPGRSDLELLTMVDGVYGMIRLGALQTANLDPGRARGILKDMALQALLDSDVTSAVGRST
jgi:AcrR family transcriptional regulator